MIESKVKRSDEKNKYKICSVSTQCKFNSYNKY